MARLLPLVFGLTQVETVALWASLLVGVTSVVLAVVAIYFSIEVDRRSTQTASETLRALERVEAGVHAQSQDTRDLIKVGWERMLGGTGPTGRVDPVSAPDSEIRQVVAGLVGEIRSELGLAGQEEDMGGDIATGVEDGPARTTDEGRSQDALEAFENAIQTLEQTLETQMRQLQESPAEEAEFWLRRLSEQPDEVRAVARLISGAHVTRDQMRRLLREAPRTGRALRELRTQGLLVPLEGRNSADEETTVYYFPPGSSRVIRAALQLAPDPPASLVRQVTRDLEKVGYPDVPRRRGNGGHGSDEGASGE